jgi:hypothetical protein
MSKREAKGKKRLTSLKIKLKKSRPLFISRTNLLITLLKEQLKGKPSINGSNILSLKVAMP